jgi:hypothetical protein
MSTRTRGIPTASASSDIERPVFLCGFSTKPFTSLAVEKKEAYRE